MQTPTVMYLQKNTLLLGRWDIWIWAIMGILERWPQPKDQSGISPNQSYDHPGWDVSTINPTRNREGSGFWMRTGIVFFSFGGDILLVLSSTFVEIKYTTGFRWYTNSRRWITKQIPGVQILPGKLTWNLISSNHPIESRKTIFQASVVRFHVNFPGVHRDHSITYFWGNQTLQIYGNSQGFPLQ